VISFVNHSKFLAPHQIFEEEKKTSEKEKRMKEENQKKIENIMNNKPRPPT